MASQSPSITLVQSRALIAAVSIALFGGTTIAGGGFVRLAAEAFGSARDAPAIVFILVIYAAVTAFLCYLCFLCVATAARPRKLIISTNEITEIARNGTRSQPWRFLSNPTKRVVNSRGAGLIIYIDFDQQPSDTFSVRVDIYSESPDDVLTLVQSAMAGDTLFQPRQRLRIAYYLLAGFATALIVFAVHFVVVRTPN